MKYFFLGIMVFSVFFGTTILAAPNFRDASASLGSVGSETGLGDKDLPTVVGTSINIALSMVGLIFLILTVYAGLLWMTAQGDESKVEKARKMIIAAVIGLTIVMSASGITYLITSRFESDAPSGGGAGGQEVTYCLCQSVGNDNEYYCGVEVDDCNNTCGLLGGNRVDSGTACSELCDKHSSDGETCEIIS